MGGAPRSPSWWQRKALLPVWAWIAVGVLAAAAVVVVSQSGNDADEVSTDSANSSESIETSETEESTVDTSSEETVADTAAADTEPSVLETSPSTETTPATEPPDSSPPRASEVSGAPSGVTGTHASPVPVGQVADLGQGWRLQILDVIADGTAAVAAESSFNEPPPEGSAFTLVTVALGYFGVEDPRSAFEITISAVGANNTELSSECGVIPQELDGYSDMFAGAVVSGNLCFVTTPGDVPALQVYGEAGYFDVVTIFLDASAASAGAVPMAGLSGPQTGAAATAKRLAPLAIGSAADVGEGWQVTVTGPATDITDAIVTENQFNEPPPDGFRFVGVPLSFAYSGTESTAPYVVALNAVAAGNRQLSTNCGVVPGELDQYSDVFAGGVVTGVLCWVVPADQIADLVLYGTATFDDGYAWFATD